MTFDKKLCDKNSLKIFDETFRRSFVDNKSGYVAYDISLVTPKIKEAITYSIEKKLLSKAGYGEKQKLLGGVYSLDFYKLTEKGKEYFNLKHA